MLHDIFIQLIRKGNNPTFFKSSMERTQMRIRRNIIGYRMLNLSIYEFMVDVAIICDPLRSSLAVREKLSFDVVFI